MASARSSTAARRSSSTVFAGLLATSTMRRRRRGDPVVCWSAQSCSASRWGPPLGARGPETSSSALSLSDPGSRVGAGVGVLEGFAAAQAEIAIATANASIRRCMGRASLGARSVRQRVVRRIHVSRRIFGTRVGLALGLHDRALDLVGQRDADLFELLIGHARRQQVLTGALDGIPRSPLLDLLLGAVPSVVAVRRVRLIAVALELD